ncbi:hypothetical protein ElyMa_002453900 [Elysia marginata]|uniref:Uncharacterized protein n=1 Tax=Elysia marginata TaxID=1093978 RepID=A0AAV4GKV4_9GAST|nr:hypothetical protein ElyMa_002453900 [Elysia marginata]
MDQTKGHNLPTLIPDRNYSSRANHQRHQGQSVCTGPLFLRGSSERVGGPSLRREWAVRGIDRAAISAWYSLMITEAWDSTCYNR